MPADSHNFFECLHAFSDFADFSDPDHYRPLPDDWCIVVTDIENSTGAIEAGRYKEVNSVGVASIVALQNMTAPLQFPYVFGGDGAVACLPASLRPEIAKALNATKAMARERFGLTLRNGIVDIRTLRESGHGVRVGRYAPNPHYVQAMLSGSGIVRAEKLVKDKAAHNPYVIVGEHDPDVTHELFKGFECRWNEIKSPSESDISLIVQVLPGAKWSDTRVHALVLEAVHHIYGEEEQHHPLRENLMSLTGSFRLLNSEASIRTAFLPWPEKLLYLLKLQLYRWIGIWLIGRKVKTEGNDWGRYKSDLIANSDYRKFDNVLRMILAGTEDQHRRLRGTLEAYRADGLIAYGLHISPASLVTCIVTDYNHRHVHFLDGSDGGYAMAAKELKRQLKPHTKDKK